MQTRPTLLDLRLLHRDRDWLLRLCLLDLGLRLLAQLLVLLEVELKAQFLVDGLVDPQIDLKDLFLKLVAVLIQLFDGLVDFHDVLADLLLSLALALAVLGH